MDIVYPYRHTIGMGPLGLRVLCCAAALSCTVDQVGSPSKFADRMIGAPVTYDRRSQSRMIGVPQSRMIGAPQSGVRARVQSGLGREHSKYGISEFLDVKFVSMGLGYSGAEGL